MPNQQILTKYASALVKSGGDPNIPAYPIIELTNIIFTLNAVDKEQAEKIRATTEEAVKRRRGLIATELRTIDDFLDGSHEQPEEPKKEIITEAKTILEPEEEQANEMHPAVEPAIMPKDTLPLVIPPLDKLVTFNGHLASEEIKPAPEQVTHLEDLRNSSEKTIKHVFNGGVTLIDSYPYILKEAAMLGLNSATRDHHFVKEVLSFLRAAKHNDSQMVLKDHFDRVMQITKTYSSLKIEKVLEMLGFESIPYTLNVLSSYPNPDIKDLVRVINPYFRYSKTFYVIKDNFPLNGLSEHLESISNSLKEGDFSYRGISQVIQERRMPANNPHFDQVVELMFEKNANGTFTKETTEEFRAKTRGYRFMKITNLFDNDRQKIDRNLGALKGYHGELVIPIDLTQSSLFQPGTPEVMYLFRCSESGLVNIETLEKELGTLK